MTSARELTTRPGRIAWADTARGIAISLVALYHASNWLFGAGLPVDGWQEANLVLATLRMPLFFVVAGLFATKWLTASWGDLWRSKLVLFIWVFLVWEVIGTFTLQLGLITKDQCCGVADSVLGVLLSPVMPRFELWFIWALAIFFTVAKLTRRLDPRIQLVVAGIASAIALSGWVTPNVGWSGVVKYYFFFLAGLYLRSLVLRIGEIRSLLVLGGIVLLWAGVSFSVWLFALTTVPGVYFLNALLGVVAGVAASRLLSRLRFLREIGTQTLPVYLAHTPIILVLSFLLWATPFDAAIDTIAVALPPVLAAVAIALALLLHARLVRTPLRVLYEPPRALVAGRRPRALQPDEGPTRSDGAATLNG